MAEGKTRAITLLCLSALFNIVFSSPGVSSNGQFRVVPSGDSSQVADALLLTQSPAPHVAVSSTTA